MKSISLNQQKEMHPKGVSFIAFTQLWESFSFFGMRALLVLYLVSQGGYSYSDAVILYTLYIAFVKVFASIGGYAVDAFLGYKRAVILGGSLIALGHFLLTLSSSQPLFFLALGCIICGSALYRVSLQVFLGLLYEKDDPRREKGFTLLYVCMNLGGLLAAVFCGFVANIYGWHVGFGLAATGMVISLGVFVSKIKNFSIATEEKKAPLLLMILLLLTSSIAIGAILSQFKSVHFFALPFSLIALVTILTILRKKLTKTLLFSISGAFFLLIAFFTAEELWGSLLMVFSETHIERSLFGFEIPSSVLAATNPLTIILLGPFIAKREIRFRLKLALAFLSLSLAFFTLYIASILSHPSSLYLILGLGLVALGELFLAPTILSFASKSGPKESSGMMMGATTVSFSMGSLLSGTVANIPFAPKTTFMLIGSIALAFFIVLLGGAFLRRFALSKKIN